MLPSLSKLGVGSLINDSSCAVGQSSASWGTLKKAFLKSGDFGTPQIQKTSLQDFPKNYTKVDDIENLLTEPAFIAAMENLNLMKLPITVDTMIAFDDYVFSHTYSRCTKDEQKTIDMHVEMLAWLKRVTIAELEGASYLSRPLNIGEFELEILVCIANAAFLDCLETTRASVRAKLFTGATTQNDSRFIPEMRDIVTVSRSGAKDGQDERLEGERALREHSIRSAQLAGFMTDGRVFMKTMQRICFGDDCSLLPFERFNALKAPGEESRLSDKNFAEILGTFDWSYLYSVFEQFPGATPENRGVFVKRMQYGVKLVESATTTELKEQRRHNEDPSIKPSNVSCWGSMLVMIANEAMYRQLIGYAVGRGDGVVAFMDAKFQYANEESFNDQSQYVPTGDSFLSRGLLHEVYSYAMNEASNAEDVKIKQQMGQAAQDLQVLMQQIRAMRSLSKRDVDKTTIDQIAVAHSETMVYVHTGQEQKESEKLEHYKFLPTDAMRKLGNVYSFVRPIAQGTTGIEASQIGHSLEPIGFRQTGGNHFSPSRKDYLLSERGRAHLEKLKTDGTVNRQERDRRYREKLQRGTPPGPENPEDFWDEYDLDQSRKTQSQIEREKRLEERLKKQKADRARMFMHQTEERKRADEAESRAYMLEAQRKSHQMYPLKPAPVPLPPPRIDEEKQLQQMKENEAKKALQNKALKEFEYGSLRLMQEYYYPISNASRSRILFYYDRTFRDSVPAVDIKKAFDSSDNATFTSLMLMVPRLLFLLGTSIKPLEEVYMFYKFYPLMWSFSQRNMDTPLNKEMKLVEQHLTGFWTRFGKLNEGGRRVAPPPFEAFHAELWHLSQTETLR